MKAKFHLPGLRFLFPVNMMLLQMMQQYPQFFREDIEIASFYGEFPTSRWNGGRIGNDDQCDANFIRMVIKTINGYNIPVRYTFTNPLITQKDLNDPYCNFCMDAANNGQNEVLVVSPILESYIRTKYPNFKVNSSTCKEIRDVEMLNAELEKDYHLVVLDYNFNNRFDILEQIEKKDKCELLINPCCMPNCPRRGEHYRYLAKMQTLLLENRALPPNKRKPIEPWHCPAEERFNPYEIRKYPTHISPDDIWDKYLPMGYENFKIEGRTSPILSIVDTYCYYLMKPECRDEGRLAYLCMLEQRNILSLGKPRKMPWKDDRTGNR